MTKKNGITDDLGVILSALPDDIRKALEKVGRRDELVEVILHWGQSGVPEDLNEDGIVDEIDLDIVIDEWGPC